MSRSPLFSQCRRLYRVLEIVPGLRFGLRVEVMNFEFQRMRIPDVILIRGQSVEDRRGMVREGYRTTAFAEHGVRELFVQDNFSHSIKGVLRGLHYQKEPSAQGKLVVPLRGDIFDVAVDIRKGSPTYGDWIGITLSAREGVMLYVPVGFAHGFRVMSDQADVLYKVTSEYSPELDRGIIWNDSTLNLRWPGEMPPLLSRKDASLPLLSDADNDFTYQAVVKRFSALPKRDSNKGEV